MVIVNTTTPDGPVKAQMLKKSTYAELEYDSVVYWPGASTWGVKQLDEAINKNVFKACPPLGITGVKEMVAEGEVRGLIKAEVLKELKAGGC